MDIVQDMRIADVVDILCYLEGEARVRVNRDGTVHYFKRGTWYTLDMPSNFMYDPHHNRLMRRSVALPEVEL